MAHLAQAQHPARDTEGNPIERGLWIGEREPDGQALFWLVTSGGVSIAKGKLDYDAFGHAESRAMWLHLNSNDSAVRLTA